MHNKFLSAMRLLPREVVMVLDVEEELEGGFPLGAGRVSTMPPPPMVRLKQLAQ